MFTICLYFFFFSHCLHSPYDLPLAVPRPSLLLRFISYIPLDTFAFDFTFRKMLHGSRLAMQNDLIIPSVMILASSCTCYDSNTRHWTGHVPAGGVSSIMPNNLVQLLLALLLLVAPAAAGVA